MSNKTYTDNLITDSVFLTTLSSDSVVYVFGSGISS